MALPANPTALAQQARRAYVEGLLTGLSKFMDGHGFKTVQDMVGKSLPYFTTHADLVERQRKAKREKAGEANRDAVMWAGNIAKETEKLAGD